MFLLLGVLQVNFLDVLDFIFSNLSDVVSAIDSDTLFSLGTVNITLWNLILGGLICFIIFGFFLRTRGGSAWDTASNILSYENKKEEARFRSEQARVRHERLSRSRSSNSLHR